MGLYQLGFRVSARPNIMFGVLKKLFYKNLEQIKHVRVSSVQKVKVKEFLLHVVERNRENFTLCRKIKQCSQHMNSLKHFKEIQV